MAPATSEGSVSFGVSPIKLGSFTAAFLNLSPDS